MGTTNENHVRKVLNVQEGWFVLAVVHLLLNQ